MSAPDRACPDYPGECMHPWAHARTHAEGKATQDATGPDDVESRIEAAIRAEHRRIRAALIPVLLAAVRCIPDGRIQAGCVVHDGATVRASLKAAFNEAVPDHSREAA